MNTLGNLNCLLRVYKRTSMNVWKQNLPHQLPMASIRFRSTMIRPLRDWRLWGILPRSENSTSYRVGLIVVHSLVWIFLACFVLSLTEAQSLSDIIVVLNFATTLILMYIKAACLRHNLPNINIILDLMDQLDNVDNPKEQQFMQEADKRSKLLYNLMARFGIFGVTCFTIPPLLNGQLMFPALYPFDWNASRPIYLLTFLYQSCCNNFVIFLIASIDTYGPAMWSFLTAYIDILRNRLENLGSQNEYPKVCEKNLKECIRIHISLLK